jgi:hypothetical protein
VCASYIYFRVYCVYVLVIVDFLLLSFKLILGRLFRPHHVNQGGVQKTTPQVTLYKPDTAKESLRRRRTDRHSQVLTGRAGQAWELLLVLLPPHERVCVSTLLRADLMDSWAEDTGNIVTSIVVSCLLNVVSCIVKCRAGILLIHSFPPVIVIQFMLLLKLTDHMFPVKLVIGSREELRTIPSIIFFKRKVTPPDEELRTIPCHPFVFHFTDEKFCLLTF